MAIEETVNDLHIITVGKKEATDIIGLLAAQLANVALSGHQLGATPSINIVENGQVKYRIVILLEGRKIKIDKHAPMW